MKVVINRCFGGFSISKQAAEFMAARGNKQAEAELERVREEGRWFGFGYSKEFPHTYSRTDPDLIAAVETLEEDASELHSTKLVVVEIPDGIDFEIMEHDGLEHIAEAHRTWH